LIGFSKPGVPHTVSPRCFQRLGYFAPLSFPAYGGKIQATRCAGGRWLLTANRFFSKMSFGVPNDNNDVFYGDYTEISSFDSAAFSRKDLKDTFKNQRFHRYPTRLTRKTQFIRSIFPDSEFKGIEDFLNVQQVFWI
jgi:hypothetical protein